MVDAVITAVHGSFLFTQDLEDIQSAYNQLKDNQTSRNQSTGYQNRQSNNQGQKNSYGKNNGYNNKGQNSWNNKSGSSQRSSNSSYGNKSGAGTNNSATDKQINLIEQLISRQRISRDQVCMELEKRFSTVDYRSLNRQQASDFIQALQDMQPWAS